MENQTHKADDIILDEAAYDAGEKAYRDYFEFPEEIPTLAFELGLRAYLSATNKPIGIGEVKNRSNHTSEPPHEASEGKGLGVLPSHDQVTNWLSENGIKYLHDPLNGKENAIIRDTLTAIKALQANTAIAAMREPDGDRWRDIPEGWHVQWLGIDNQGDNLCQLRWHGGVLPFESDGSVFISRTGGTQLEALQECLKSLPNPPAETAKG